MSELRFNVLFNEDYSLVNYTFLNYQDFVPEQELREAAPLTMTTSSPLIGQELSISPPTLLQALAVRLVMSINRTPCESTKPIQSTAPLRMAWFLATQEGVLCSKPLF